MQSGGLPSLAETAVVRESLQRGARAQMRGLMECRKVAVSAKRVRGDTCVEVTLGSTRVVVVVSCEVVAPAKDRPNEGQLRVYTEFSPASMPPEQHRDVASAARGAEVGLLIEDTIKDSKAIDAEALCISSGLKAWSVRCDVRIMDACGNCIDAAMLAVVAGLHHFRLPAVEMVGPNAKVFDIDERAPVPLSIHHVPLSTTFGMLSGKRDDGETDEEVVFIDPTHREEMVADGTMSVTTNSFGEVCAVHKFGAPAIEPDTLFRMIDVAAQKCKAWEELIKEGDISQVI